MNIHTLTEMQDYHSAKAEDLRKVSRVADRDGEWLDEEQRHALLMHERFVTALCEVLASNPKP